MIAGRKPFQGENLTVVSHRIVYDGFTPPRQYVRDLPPEVERILARALDGLGQVAGGLEIKTNLAGYLEFAEWLRRLGDKVVVGIEGADRAVVSSSHKLG